MLTPRKSAPLKLKIIAACKNKEVTPTGYCIVRIKSIYQSNVWLFWVELYINFPLTKVLNDVYITIMYEKALFPLPSL